MAGRKLSQQLAGAGNRGGKELTPLSLVDAIDPQKPANFSQNVCVAVADLSLPEAAAKWVATRPDVIFHLAAVVSGEAQADFGQGYRGHLDGTRQFFEAIRQEGTKTPFQPRLVFTSTIAVFGAPFPDVIGDEFFTTPLTSYGTQKAMAELLLADYSRRGFFDGIGIRLPTICIRPGKPNQAASSFFSGILR